MEKNLKVLRGMFVSKREEVMGEHYIRRIFMICTLRQV
jgi:hypothetical protein